MRRQIISGKTGLISLRGVRTREQKKTKVAKRKEPQFEGTHDIFTPMCGASQINIT